MSLIIPLAAAATSQSHAALLMFLAFVAATLVITYFSARKSSGSSAYFAASRRITGWQNGLAVAGDYMSAASFLGISGMIAFFGYDGFMYSVGWLVAYLTVLIIVAEPLRNAGKYTMADLLAYRLKQRPVRAMASLSTLTVSTFYMIAQMVGAGALVKLLLPGVSFNAAVIGVGILMIIYVVFGGMLATTWVQIIKAILLMAGRSSAQSAGHGSLWIQLCEVLRGDFSRHLSRQGRGGDQKLSGAGVEVWRRGHKRMGTARPCLTRSRAGVWYGGTPPYPGSILHGSGRQNGAHLRRLGNVDYWRFLHHDHLSWFWRGDDSHAGSNRR